MNAQSTVLDLVTGLLRELQRTEEKQYPFVRQTAAAPISISLSMQTAEPVYDTLRLEGVLLGMIADNECHNLDPTHLTTLLKDTNFPGSKLLDNIKRNLPDYRMLKCVVVDNHEVVVKYTNPLQISEITTLLQEELGNDARFIETKGPRGHKRVQVMLDGEPILSLGQYELVVPYQRLAQEEKLKTGIEAVCGLTTRIHQDLMFSREARRVFLAEYKPIFEMACPELFEPRLGSFLQEVRAHSRNGQIPHLEDFKETVLSQLNPEQGRQYSLARDSLPDHMQYIVVAPDKQEIYMRFSSNLDYVRIQRLVEEQGLHMVECHERRPPITKAIRKGGGYRTKTLHFSTKAYDVRDQAGRTILTFEGQNTVKLHGGQSDENFAQAEDLLNKVYYGRMLYTSWTPIADLDSDISKEERMVISAFDPLVTIYRHFLEVEDQKRAFDSGSAIKSAPEWVADRMKESSNKSFEQRIFYVLQELNRRITPEQMKAQAQALEPVRTAQLYGVLQNLVGRFEAATKLRSQ